MKKVFISICLLLLSFSCSEKSENKNLSSGTSSVTINSYETYKSYIESSEWYKSLLKKSGKNKIDFTAVNAKELGISVDLTDESGYDRAMEKHYVFSPNREYALDSYTYGLEIDPDTGEEFRDADRSVILYDIKNNQNASIIFIGPSGSIDLVEWINENTFLIITTDHETEEKDNVHISVYNIKNGKIYKTDGFQSEVFLK